MKRKKKKKQKEKEQFIFRESDANLELGRELLGRRWGSKGSLRNSDGDGFGGIEASFLIRSIYRERVGFPNSSPLNCAVIATRACKNLICFCKTNVVLSFPNLLAVAYRIYRYFDSEPFYLKQTVKNMEIFFLIFFY